jgi:hypothetical protein
MWSPAIHEAFGPDVYPMFRGLVEKLRPTLGEPGPRQARS